MVTCMRMTPTYLSVVCVVRLLYYYSGTRSDTPNQDRPWLQRVACKLCKRSSHSPTCRGLTLRYTLRLLALKEKEMRPAQPLHSKLAYINASFVILLYTMLAYTRILTYVMSMDASNCMTCVCYFLSASTKCCICSCCPHARMGSNEWKRAKPFARKYHQR